MNFVAGIDIGSRTTKAVILDESRNIRGTALTRTRPDFPGVAKDVLAQALAQAGGQLEDVKYLATTGLGRYNVPFRDLQITDITCAARGAAFLFPNTKCVLDVGGQSTRAIRLREKGKVKEFKSNDKCAAGSGGFLERAAHYLEVPVEQLGPLSIKAKNPQAISSVCAVLAESEIINLVSSGQTMEDIIRGIHNSLATRSRGLLARVGMEPEVTFVGGVARQSGMVAALKETLGQAVNVSDDPDLVTALGAALLGLQRYQKRQGETAPPSRSEPQNGKESKVQ
ncbi:MAG: 2-hydroxyglutaryl-CoA dehydratase [Acidobacteria bacterium]|nr:2-hydroxyglutaryl-CoA dehydratase [Acidobacteriota bacterium]